MNFKYRPTVLAEVQALYKLPKEERDAYIAEYDKVVDQKRKEVLNFAYKIVYHRDKQVSRFSKEFYFFEGPVLKKLLSTPLMKGCALMIPSFEESCILSALTQCKTAFMSSKPFRMVLFYDHIQDMNKLGILFLLAHEAQHYSRLHFKRQGDRDGKLWNIATDCVINRNVLMSFLPTFMTNGDIIKTDFHYSELLTNPAVFFRKDYELPKNHKMSCVGYPTKATSFYKSLDDRTWFKDPSLEKMSEEEIYAWLEQNLSDKDLKSFSDMVSFEGKTISWDELFGDAKDEMIAKYKNFIYDFGAPRTAEDRKFLNDQEKELIKEFLREMRNNRHKVPGSGTGDFEDILKRNDQIDSKIDFQNFLMNLYSAKANKGVHKEKTELTRFSKMTLIPDIQEALGHKNQLKLYKNKFRGSEFKALVICDTSGSVSIAEICDQYLNEIYNIVKHHNFTIDMFSADTELKLNNKIVLNKDTIDQYVSGFPFIGGGGTEMLRPLAKGLAYENYDLAIILSDGYYSSFTKDQLFAEMYEEYKNMQDVKIRRVLEKRQYKRGQFYNPPIVLLNTQEKVFGNAFSTFQPNELLEFVLNENTEKVTVEVKGFNKFRQNKFGKNFGKNKTK